MSGKTSSILPGHQRQDIEQLTFAERVQLGAENAVRCMGVTANDRIFIMTDYERESIARHVAMAALDSIVSAARVPGPPELLPGRPDAIVDLQTEEGAALVGGGWRYADAAEFARAAERLSTTARHAITP